MAKRGQNPTLKSLYEEILYIRLLLFWLGAGPLLKIWKSFTITPKIYTYIHNFAYDFQICVCVCVSLEMVVDFVAGGGNY